MFPKHYSINVDSFQGSRKRLQKKQKAYGEDARCFGA